MGTNSVNWIGVDKLRLRGGTVGQAIEECKVVLFLLRIFSYLITN